MHLRITIKNTYTPRRMIISEKNWKNTPDFFCYTYRVCLGYLQTVIGISGRGRAKNVGLILSHTRKSWQKCSTTQENDFLEFWWLEAKLLKNNVWLLKTNVNWSLWKYFASMTTKVALLVNIGLYFVKNVYIVLEIFILVR